MSALSIAASDCSHNLNVKLYKIDNSEGGLVRKQENELLRFIEAEGFFCMSPEDTRTVIEACIQDGR